MKVLVIAEHDNHQLRAGTLSVITAAAKLGGSIDVLVAGHECRAVAEHVAQYDNVASVLLADHACYEHQLVEATTPLLVSLARDYAAILAAATTTGKSLLPRIAALLDVGQISEVLKIESPDTFVRPIYAGNALATLQSRDAIKVLSIRTTAFEPAAKSLNTAAIVVLDTVTEQQQSRFLNEKTSVSARPELPAANIVIAGGRGMQSGENFQILGRIADKLGAAVGASRAAVDAGYVGNDLQVGQTGKIVAPDLYIAVGISGAIQHLAGMKDSKVIVAINKDADAPIFQVADYGLVADLFEALPEFEALL
ncbi:MAG: FAD-binding protein [Pseudomonadales bacterium]|nr:FAD-binding protein [Pseudomonadales bacterium]